MNEDPKPRQPVPKSWIREERAELWSLLSGRTVGVLGYGNQGRAQALILQDQAGDHGFEVVVGSRRDGPGERAARADGFDPLDVSELVERCSVLVSLIPDEMQAEVLSGSMLSRRRPGQEAPLLCLAHGFALTYGGLKAPDHWDVVLVAPTGPGTKLREEFVAGRGLPGLVAVHQDASGRARERAMALAQALGLLRGGVYETTVENETVVDLFGEQAVLCGGLIALCQASFEALVEKGYPPDLAYLECIQQIGVTSDLLTRYGPEGFRRRISRTALYGELTRGPRIINDQVRKNLAEVLDEIVSGRFGREWMSESAGGGRRLQRLLEEAGRHSSNEVFRRLPRNEEST